MLSRNLLISLIIGLGLTLALLWGLELHSRIAVHASAPDAASILSTTVVYYDDFENPTSGWPEIDQLVITSTDTHYRLRYENGQYRITVDQGDPQIWFHQPDAFAPYSPPSDKYCAEVDVKVEEGQLWASGGLVFGASEDNTNLYALCMIVGTGGSSMGWQAFNNSSYDYPLSACSGSGVGGESTGLSKDAWHRLQASVDGDTVEIWIDGVYKGTYAMSGLQDTTRVGLVGGGYEIFPVDYRFDNFRVRPNASCNVSYVCKEGLPFCDYTTVQAAVDAANDGGLIKVASGTYTDISSRAGATQTVYISKTVTIRGGYTTTNSFADPPDPEANPTTLDAQQQGRVFYIVGNISPTIEGLRITGGDATGAGGITDSGGGALAVSATLTISNSTIVDNVARYGGGLYLRRGEVTLRENAIISNTSTWVGGGLYVWDGEIVIEGNTIVSNTAETMGGGMLLWSSEATIADNFIARNRVFTGISYSSGGGGVYLEDGCTATLVNNIITENKVDVQGSGVYVDGSVAHMLHNTIVHNTAHNVTGEGTGVYVNVGLSSTVVVMTNTILTNHGTGVYAEAGTSVWMNSVLWYENTIANTDGSGGFTITNDITGTPAFADDGYHLSPWSAAIDQGVSTWVMTDIDGDVRPIRLLPDLGADEALPWHYMPFIVKESES